MHPFVVGLHNTTPGESSGNFLLFISYVLGIYYIYLFRAELGSQTQTTRFTTYLLYSNMYSRSYQLYNIYMCTVYSNHHYPYNLISLYYAKLPF